MDTGVGTQTYRFGDFELDLGAHQLRKLGQPVRLERRPMELLVFLVTRHGLLVPRAEIIERLWPAKVVIDFETGLNTLVLKVRQALGDSFDNPLFIETVARLGYRFIAPVTIIATPASDPVKEKSGRRRLLTAAAIVVVAVAAAISFATWHSGRLDGSRLGIVVLPFENLTGNENLNYLAAGLAEDTSVSMAQLDLNNVHMIGQVSARAFATSLKPLAEIGRELGVDFVIASSLRAEQSKVRITSRLIRVEDNEQVWATTFDRELTSVLGLQSELSSAIAEQVRLRLSPEVKMAITRRQTANPEAYDFYLRGKYQWSLLTRASSRRALELYRSAIARDASYALAWAGMAQVLSTAPITGDTDPVFVFPRARDAVEHAVQYGAELSEVQYALGHFHYILDWDWPAAEIAFQKSLAIDPNNALAYLFLGHVKSQSGEQAEARDLMRRARQLDPLFSHTFALSSQVAYQARDYESALEFARQAIAINPDAWVGYVQLGQALTELGNYNDALAAYDSAVIHSGGNTKAVAFRAHLLGMVGRSDEAREIAVELQIKARERYVSPYAIAMIYAGLSERAAALEWLESAYAVRDVHMVFLPVDPRWDEWRDDSRFVSLIHRCQFCGRNAALVAGRCQRADPGEAGDESVSRIFDNIDSPQTVSSANIDGIWTATATTIGGDGTISGLVDFTGPRDKTRQMGMCLLQRYGALSNGVSCDTERDCISAPENLEPGGTRYCIASENGHMKYCHYRPGAREEYCVGSPALKKEKIVPGSYRIDIPAAPGTQWRASACFNRCIDLPPSISETATVR
jgi:TolB-like protein/DNA-binding winged helix-turn-helix (wHTH) protein/Tfp pilus assembly protein PilF